MASTAQLKLVSDQGSGRDLGMIQGLGLHILFP
jgi:hypothetical protein